MYYQGGCQLSQPVSAAEYVYQGVRRMMITGELAPGDRLIQRELTERFGTSNIPVIEAIRRLEQEGLVASRPNAGASVQQWTREDIQGVYLMREVLEGLACRLFVGCASAAERAQLVEHEREYIRQVKRKDQQAWLDADMALHLHIVAVTRSRPLMRSAESTQAIVASLISAQRLRNQLGNILPPPLDAHSRLVETLTGSDPVAAEEAGRAHVHEAMNRLMMWELLQATKDA
jgi:DNA-binding GntR family transcriptional regulator